ncbi:MAG: radical SAM family heme chaperone HemW [Clostridia bacterium]|nr:radical SAM family heme chaperone HemW [Clostridia bacterium]
MEIYVHIPFCKRKCLYCDFNSYVNADGLIFGYLTALNREIALASDSFLKLEKNKKITSVFIGGGTPSLLPANCIEALIENVKNSFTVDDDAEITIEANPESLTEEKLAIYKRAGINRLSIGVQSLFDDNLKAIGRIHDAKTAQNAVALAKKYFDNISCDLMIGLPYDTKARVCEEVEKIAEAVDHLSVYQLILEEGTPLDLLVEEGKITLPADDEVADLMDAAVKTLRENGFSRYEVSNFARDGKISRHNLGYWTREEYLGFGAGASTFLKMSGQTPYDAEVRYSSANSIEKYVENVNGAEDYFDIPRENVEKLDDDAIVDERIMLGLRTAYGIEKKLLPISALEKYQRYFLIEGDKVRLTDEGFAIMNSVLVDVMQLK